MGENILGRVIPDDVLGNKPLFAGAFARSPQGRKASPPLKAVRPGENKVLASIKEAIKASGLKSGMTISFHHHLRNGDYVLNMVLEACAELGLKDLTVASSSIFPIHAPLVEHIKNGVVTGLDCNYALGPVAEAVTRGLLPRPMIMRTHGGRVRAIESGDLHIDVAFIAAPAADAYGNINGVDGPSACGSLGYAMADAQYADYVVAITDNLMPYPLHPISISQSLVDAVVVVDKIGDPKGIVSGSTRITRDPVGLTIANYAAQVIEAAGLVKEGISFQTGAGGASLAVAAYLRKYMEERHVTGAFGMGGITGYFVELLEAGLLRTILDTQCFDLVAVKSLKRNPNHIEIDAGMYANPWNKGAVVNLLDTVILGATEIDTDFNVNVTTSSDGIIMGGSGGHSDTAAGSKLTIIVTTATRTRLPIVRDRVTTVTTPGETVDVVVTERGICVNPRRQDLIEKLSQRRLPVLAIEELKQQVEDLTGKPAPARTSDRVVALVEYRDGSIIDAVYQVE
ncbi:MAG TPA: citrate lyase subunit alpha [Firmicutes bacterium]|nr:citrate lyase subunit alpha [Candidatus Fermentithermobacillaceae bacterium]